MELSEDEEGREVETLFAEWLRRRESGQAEDFESLLEAHPGHVDRLRDLQAAWKLLSRAVPAAPQFSPWRAGAAPGDERYRRIELLGRGGQGEVWLAEDRRLGRRVALKLVHSGHPARWKRFEREAAVTSRLDHPGICPVFESGEEGGQLFIAMRFIDGESLAERIRSRNRAEQVRPTAAGSSSSSGPSGNAEVRTLVRIVAGAARALHAAHEAGVIHRDVKPANILVTHEEQPVLVDFGLAEDSQGDWTELTASAECLGTPAYMSPEQLQGKGRAAVDRRADVWSLGVTLYEALTGERPFEGPTSMATFRAITHDQASRARSINRALPVDLDVVLATALEKDRDRRYASAAAFADDLEAWLAGRPISARPVSAIGRLGRWAKREPALAVTAGSLALLLPLAGALATHALLTRDAVLAGESAQADLRLETVLAEGFRNLGNWQVQAAVRNFDEALDLDVDCQEARTGRLLAVLQEDRAAAMQLLETLPSVRSGSFLDRFRTEVVQEEPLAAGVWEWLITLPEPVSEAEHFLAAWILIFAPPGVELGLQDVNEMSFLAQPFSEPQKYERARDHLLSALLLADSPRLLYLQMLGLALTRCEGSPELLWSLYEAIVRRWPNAYESQGIMAEALLFPAPERARQILERLRERLPEDARLLSPLGTAYAMLGDRERAESTMRKAIELNPDSPVLHYNLGVELIAQYRFEEACQLNRESVRLSPSYAAGWSNLALCLYHMGAFQESIDASLQCLRYQPGQAYALGQIARAALRLGDSEQALARAGEAREVTRVEQGWALDGAALFEQIELVTRAGAELEAWLEKGELEPTPEQHAELAWRALQLGRFEEAAGLFADLEVSSPELFQRPLVRLHAASSAAWAGSTEGPAAESWRERALDWLEDALVDFRPAPLGAGQLSGAQAEELNLWQMGPELAPLRYERWLTGASARSRERCQALWNTVAQRLE